MTIEDQIRHVLLLYVLIERLQKYQLFHQSGKIDKHEYLTGEERLPSNQQRIIEQTKFTYSPWEKRFKIKEKKRLIL